MNIYNIFTAVVVVLIHLLHTNDHYALAPLLEAPEPNTTYSICYIVASPAVPFTIDPSPPVLAPPFDPDYAFTLPHTLVGATSVDYDADSLSVNWVINLLVVVISGLLVHEAVAWFSLHIGNGSPSEVSPTVQNRPPSSITGLPTPPLAPPTPSTPLTPPFWSSVNDPSPRSVFVSIPFYPPTATSIEDSDRVVLSSRSICAAAPSQSLDSSIRPSISVPIVSDTADTSFSPMSSLRSSSSLSNEEGLLEAPIPFSGDSSVSTGSIAITAAQSVRNFLDEITLALSPSPSFVTRIPPAPPKALRNLWEDLVDVCFSDEPSVWDCYPRATPRTPVDLDDEVTEDHEESGATDAIEPPFHAWTMDTDESTAILTSAVQSVERVEFTTELAGPSRGASTRVPRLAPTSVWKKSINALVDGNGKRAARSCPTPISPTKTARTSTDVVATTSSSTTPAKIDWSEDVEQILFNPSGGIAAEKMEETLGVERDKRASKAQVRAFEKCDCALENAIFEPECWNKLKIPASCHPRPPIHFFPPRDVDKSNPSTRIAVDNVNAFPHHSAEPNLPYANKDIEDLFYPVGANNVRCFDGRIVEGVLRYSTSYAIVDFETVEDAMAAFKMFQGRKAYPGSFHLRLRFVNVNDKTFGRRMAASLGPMERSEEERKSFAEFVEDLDRVDVDLAKVVMPSRPGFALPSRPVSPSGS